MTKEAITLNVCGKPFRVNKLDGDGMCSCRGCEQKNGWNRIWTSWCYEYKGDIYCYSCLKEVLAKEARAMMKEPIDYDLETVLLVGDEVKVWNLVKKYPDEIGFVLGCKDYLAYLETYLTVVNDETEIKPDLTEEEFKVLKQFFGNRYNENSY